MSRHSMFLVGPVVGAALIVSSGCAYGAHELIARFEQDIPGQPPSLDLGDAVEGDSLNSSFAISTMEVVEHQGEESEALEGEQALLLSDHDYNLTFTARPFEDTSSTKRSWFLVQFTPVPDEETNNTALEANLTLPGNVRVAGVRFVGNQITALRYPLTGAGLASPVESIHMGVYVPAHTYIVSMAVHYTGSTPRVRVRVQPVGESPLSSELEFGASDDLSLLGSPTWSLNVQHGRNGDHALMDAIVLHDSDAILDSDALP